MEVYDKGTTVYRFLCMGAPPVVIETTGTQFYVLWCYLTHNNANCITASFCTSGQCRN